MKRLMLFAAAAATLAAAPLAAQTIAIQGGKVYTMAGAPIDNGTVLIRDGKIVAVGTNVAVPAGAKVIDAHGAVVTPGFFDSDTHVGLSEVEGVRETNDFFLQNEDQVTPAFDVADGLNPASIVIPVTRIAGVTTVVSAPSGGLLAGQGVVIDLAGDRVGDMMVKNPVAMYATLGEGAKGGVGKGARAGETMALRELLDDARFYAQNRAAYDRGETRELSASRLDLQALQPVLAGTEPLVVEAHRASDIRTALQIAKEYDLKLVILGGTEAWRVADDLARANVPVVLKVLQNLPESFEELGARYDNAAILRKHGVKVAISTMDTHNARNIDQEAGNAVAYGLPYEEALKAITLYPAQIWGVADSHGSLEPGKTADVVVWGGDPLELLTPVEHVIIAGQEIPLVSRQTKLRDRYMNPGDQERAYDRD